MEIDRDPYNPAKFKLESYSDFLFNFFGFGLIFAGCSSAQGAILNPLNILTINGSMYIFGILVYLLVLSHVIYALYLHSISKIFKLRLFIKATLLSLAHFNPIYIVAAVIVLDIAAIAGEYYLRKSSLINFIHIRKDMIASTTGAQIKAVYFSMLYIKFNTIVVSILFKNYLRIYNSLRNRPKRIILKYNITSTSF